MILSTGVVPNGIFVSYLKTSKTRFYRQVLVQPHFYDDDVCRCLIDVPSRGYLLLAGMGPNDCSVFIESHHYNFVINRSKHDFVDRRRSKALLFDDILC